MLNNAQKKDAKGQEARLPYTWEIIVAFALLIGILVFSIAVLGLDVHIPFVILTGLTAALAIRMGYKWEDLEKSILASISSVMQAVLILIMVGMVVGSWIQGGIVPSLIYYGLELIHPQLFLVAIFLVCSICSVATGTAWTIIGTLGVAAMGISEGMGIPLALTAGTVIGASYFGDKLSPLSDATNLHSALTGVSLFDHFKNVLKYTIPSYVISLILVYIFGRIFAPQSTEGIASIVNITETLKSTFVISPWLILPVLMVFFMVLMKIPAIPGIFFMALVGSLCAIFVQGADLKDALTALHYGYISDTDSPIVDSLLTRGGMVSMMYIASLILCVCAYSGVLDVTKILYVSVEKILRKIESAAGLMTSTVISGFVLNIIATDNYVSAVMTRDIFKSKFSEKGLDSLNLSRCLAESNAITSPLIPWNTCGITMVGMLGIPVLQYAPYAFLLYIPPLVVIFMSYLNKGILRLEPEIIANRQESKYGA
ncbi:Na+/H+ antiporter NhaC [Neobacillus drentensis]|uniref:Na+/H+ antiporter NhaC n=1 Tax=Neobacillus drentensis TaxID=220684 RepID=UPI0030033669